MLGKAWLPSTRACLPSQITSLSVADNPSWSSHLPQWETNLWAAQGLKAQSFLQEGEGGCNKALNRASQVLGNPAGAPVRAQLGKAANHPELARTLNLEHGLDKMVS